MPSDRLTTLCACPHHSLPHSLTPYHPTVPPSPQHEQASLFNYLQTDVRHDVAVGVQIARNQLYPTPAPDAFYSGNTEALAGIGLLKNYVSWTWGDALFVILDNYWGSPVQTDSGFGSDTKVGRNLWDTTIGNAQYEWLRATLAGSSAKLKFVFAHHVMGTGRGGVEAAGTFEWGNNSTVFKQKRPTWALPIHQLMVKYKVNIFFQGHDHLYCQQEKDGVIYQEVPMPSDYTYAALLGDSYTSGTKLPNSGYLRVTVSPASAKVEYVRSFLPQDESAVNKQGSIGHSYEVRAQ